VPTFYGDHTTAVVSNAKLSGVRCMTADRFVSATRRFEDRYTLIRKGPIVDLQLRLYFVCTPGVMRDIMLNKISDLHDKPGD
jgi:hypothetical protein